MTKFLLISFFLASFFFFESSAQHFIGLTKEETKNLAKKSGYHPDEMVTAQSFDYLKFVNTEGTKTLVVFFNNESTAGSAKIICDYSEYDFVIAENDKNFNRSGKNLWEYKVGNEYFTIKLEETEWYFILRIKKK